VRPGIAADVLVVGRLGRTIARLLGVAVLRALVVLLGFTATAAVAGAAWAAQDVALDVHTGDALPLTLSGGMADVAPGAPDAALRLTVTNRGGTAVRVSAVRADVTGVTHGPASCEPYLTVAQWHGALSVPAYGTSTVVLPAALSANLPPTCAAATWGLRYTAY
jgi:hypothetical protein